MLRLVAILLVLANAGYYVWTQGWLAPLGFAAPSPSEPQRITAQVRPESLKVEREGGAAAPTARPAASAGGPQAPAPGPAAATSASGPTACLQAGPLDEPAIDAIKATLATLPAASWSLESVFEPARWTVYMGKYDAATLERKKGELQRKNVVFDLIAVPALQPGLSLGRYSTEGNARTALAQLESRGVKTAKVVLERPEGRGQFLKFPAADAALQGQLAPLRSGLGSTHPLRAC